MAKDKFLVWKLEDVLAVCTPAELQKLDTIVDRMIHKKQAEGRDTVSRYIVVNLDEPYADEVRDVLKKHGDWD